MRIPAVSGVDPPYIVRYRRLYIQHIRIQQDCIHRYLSIKLFLSQSSTSTRICPRALLILPVLVDSEESHFTGCMCIKTCLHFLLYSLHPRACQTECLPFFGCKRGNLVKQTDVQDLDICLCINYNITQNCLTVYNVHSNCAQLVASQQWAG